MNHLFTIHYSRILEDWASIKTTPKELLSNRDFALLVISKIGHLLSYFSLDIRKDKEIIQLALKTSDNISIIHPDLLCDYDIALAFCLRSFENYKSLSLELQKNKEFIRTLCKKSSHFLIYVSTDILKDKDFVHTLMMDSADNYAYILQSDKYNKEYIQKVIDEESIIGVINIPGDSMETIYEISQFLQFLENIDILSKIRNKSIYISYLALNLLKNATFHSFLHVYYKDEISNFKKYIESIYSSKNANDIIPNIDLDYICSHPNVIYDIIKHLEKTILKTELVSVSDIETDLKKF